MAGEVVRNVLNFLVNTLSPFGLGEPYQEARRSAFPDSN